MSWNSETLQLRCLQVTAIIYRLAECLLWDILLCRPSYFTSLSFHSRNIAFLQFKSLDPYIRKFVRCFHHSHHMHFIDSRPIGYTAHLWAAFVLTSQIMVSFSRLHRASDIISFPILPVGVSEKAFKALPSHSTMVLIVPPSSLESVTGRKYHYPHTFHCLSGKLFRILKLHIYRTRMASVADDF